jgi:uncharacterized protein YxjI
MRYVVKIDASQPEGANALKLLKKLNAPDKAVNIKTTKTKRVKKIDGSMLGIPGHRTSKAAFGSYLAEPEEKLLISSDKAKRQTIKHLQQSKKRSGK